MIHLSDRETAILIVALGVARDESARHETRQAIQAVLAKITARMTPATFGLHVATEGEIAVGDQLQSAASRLAEWVWLETDDAPYGVTEAALEAKAAVLQWTAVRRG